MQSHGVVNERNVVHSTLREVNSSKWTLRVRATIFDGTDQSAPFGTNFQIASSRPMRLSTRNSSCSRSSRLLMPTTPLQGRYLATEHFPRHRVAGCLRNGGYIEVAKAWPDARTRKQPVCTTGSTLT